MFPDVFAESLGDIELEVLLKIVALDVFFKWTGDRVPDGLP